MKKKVIMCYVAVMAIALTAIFCSCNGCTFNKPLPNDPEPGHVACADSFLAPLVLEHTVATDREYMYFNFGGDYRWYESCIQLEDYLDEDCDGTIAGIANVFQYMTTTDSTSFDTEAVVSAYAKGMHAYDVRAGLWVGDFPLNDEIIRISFRDAFDILMSCNYPKPHSRNCVLRREVGPKPNVAPQYIFGNQRAQLYVDAATGAVTDKNPAFAGTGLDKPLGEWP